jgi:hypothetical protein
MKSGAPYQTNQKEKLQDAIELFDHRARGLNLKALLEVKIPVNSSLTLLRANMS